MKLRPLLVLASIFASLCPASLDASFIWAWGSDTNGATVVPTDLTNAVAIAAGYAHALAARDDGTVVAWGNNNFGQCNVPTGLSNVVQVAASLNYSLALKADGTVVAWGKNDAGPVNVPPTLGQVISVAAGPSGALALRADGQVVGWGDASVPADLTNAIAIAASAGGWIALLADRTVIFGGGFPFIMRGMPGLNNVTSVVGGAGYCIELGLDGTVMGWGNYNYTLGCPFPPCPYGPVDVIPSKLPGGVALFGGDNTTLALRNDGTVVAWGEETNLPPNLSAVTALSAGGHVFLALSDIPQTPQPKIEILFIGPLSRTVAVGSEAFFSVRASGSTPLSYQWYFGTNALSGQTNRWLALYNVQGTQQGTYTVVVTGPEGSVTSQPVTLSVQTALQINMVPAISLSGLAPGASYRIEYIDAIGPTNAWTPLTIISLTNNPAFYFDTSAIGQPGRLYRLVLAP